MKDQDKIIEQLMGELGELRQDEALDDELNRGAFNLNVLLLATFVVVLSGVVAMLAQVGTRSPLYLLSNAMFLIFAALVLAVCYYLSRKGHVRTGSIVFTATLTLVCVGAIVVGGTRGALPVILIIPVVIASVTLGTNNSLALAALSVAVLVTMGLLERNSIIKVAYPAPEVMDLLNMFDVGFSLLFVTLGVWLAGYSLRQSLERARKEIAERRQAEEALRESEERYRNIVELAPDGILTVNLKGVATSCNSAFLRLTGFSRDEIIGTHISKFPTLRIEDIPRYTKMLSSAIRGKPFEPFEFLWVHKDGTSRWGEAHMGLIKKGSKTTGLQLILRDISERKRADEALRESEERYRSIVELAPQGIVTVNMEGVITTCNPAFFSLTGFSEDEIVGKHLSELPALHPQEMSQYLQMLNSAIRGKMPESFEFTWVHKDGTTRWAEARVGLMKTGAERTGFQAILFDTTERKQAEEALRESEERFRQMAETSRDVFWLRDLKSGELIYITPAYEEIWGRLIEDAYPEPTCWIQDIHPEDRERVTAAVEKQAQGEPTENEYRIVWPDGSIRWIRDRVSPVYDEAGEAYRLVGIVEDITERKQAEERLQESESKFRTFTESAPVAILIYQDYRCVYANPGAEQITGYTDEELSSMEFWEFVHPDYRDAVIEGGKALERGELPVGESQLKIVAKNGEERWIDGRLEVIDYEGKRAVLISALDITDRMQAELEQELLLTQIREQAQRMQYILDTVPEGVLLLDADERLILVNPVAESELLALAGARTGDTLARLGGRPLVELLTSPPRGLWHEVAADDRVFQVIARPIEDGATLTGWVMVMRDVTQQREVERRIQQQERLAAVGQLAAGIAHDFNNIMATVVLYAQMTARMEELPATVRQRMETIDGQAKHATKLIQQILDFSRRAVLERRPLDLVPLLKEHVRLLERTLPESIEIDLDCEPDTYIVNADPTRMQQMVTNLALNAREAMSRGGELRIGLERIEIKPGESPLLPEMAPGGWVRLTVSDTGTGIPPHVLPHIFEPFFTTRAPLGSGLGLAQVHGIVGQHNGRIDVDTEVGKGTAFIIYLPVHRSEPSPMPSHAELPALPTGHGELILVVEDDAVVRRALADSLELLKYQVLEVSNGQEALEALERCAEEIALVLSDVVMPRMSGTALLHALRGQKLAVPVVMLTGHPIQREMERLRAHGLADWLPKPPELEQLAQAVARALGTE